MKHSREMIDEVLGKLHSYEKDCFHLDLSFEETSMVESKVGGYAYVPRGGKIPESAPGILLLICQLNLSELSKESDIFPLKEGILQFWLSDFARHYGRNSSDLRNQSNWRVVYYPTIEDCYTQEELQELYPTLPGSGRTYETEAEANSNVAFPLNHSSFKVRAKAGKSPLSVDDFQFDTLFTKIFNELHPEEPIVGYYALDVPNQDLEAFQALSLFGHRLLGYPDFTKSDVRTSEELQEYILLLQLDSEMVYEEYGLELNWGDLGVANWLIHPDDLANGDFSKVVFTWDSLGLG